MARDQFVSETQVNGGPVIGILGNIGAGKTTFAIGLAKEMELRAFLEDTSANPFLARLGVDSARWCLANQLWFISEASKSLYRSSSGGVLDHSLVEVVQIHSPVFAARGWLDDDELEIATELARILDSTLKQPDFYVVLEAPPKVIIDRVSRRGRAEDRAPDEEYLDAVTAAREMFLSQTNVPFLRISSTDVDFRDERAEVYRVVASRVAPK